MKGNIVEMLEEIGFTKNEARTYIALLELPQAKSGPLCRELGIPSSHIYSILKSLIDKGVVTYKVVNNVKVYSALDPESLNVLYLKKKEELEEQRKNIQESIKHLKKVPLKKETLSDYKYYEGISGVKSMWLEIGKMMKEGTRAAIFGAILKEFKELNEFYMEHHRLRIKKGVSMRMILPEDARKLGEQREKLGMFEVRYKELENEAEFGVYGDFMYIQHSGKKTARSFLIKDPIFTRSFESIFNQLWETAKK